MTLLLSLLQVDTFFKVIQIVILSIAKLIFAPVLSIEMGLGYFETVAITAISGIIGIFLFYHLSGVLIRFYKRKIRRHLRRIFAKKNKTEAAVQTMKNTSGTNAGSKWELKTYLKKIQKKWGLIGICSFTLIAIPLVSFFANKYYYKNKYTLVYLSASVIIWSFVVTTFYFFVF